MDTTIRRIERTYDELGRLEKVTSYDAATAGTAKNEVKHTYTAWGVLEKSEQDHSGEVTGGEPAVQYTYDDTATNNVAKYVRLKTVTYPNDRDVHYLYTTDPAIENSNTTAIIDSLSRVSAIATANARTTTVNNDNVIASYEYTGAALMMRKTLYPPNVKLDYTETETRTGTEDTHEGFDRLGRVENQLWWDNTGGGVEIFDIQHAYDTASNRTYAYRNQYLGYSQVYGYDGLHRLTDYQAGKLNSAKTAAEGYWLRRQQAWTLDALGNATAVQDFGRAGWYEATYDDANQYTPIDETTTPFDPDDSSGPNRETNGSYMVAATFHDHFTSNTKDNYDQRGDNDVWTVDTGNSVFKPTTVSNDTIEDEDRAVMLIGENIGVHRSLTVLSFPGGGSPATEGDYAGLVFGWKSNTDYWMYVYEKGATDSGYKKLYHVGASGTKAQVGSSVAATVGNGTTLYLSPTAARKAIMDANYNFSGSYECFPSGKVGLVASIAGTTFDRFDVQDYSIRGDTLGRWTNPTRGTYVLSDSGTEYLVPSGQWDAAYQPTHLSSVRYDKFIAEFCLRRTTAGSGVLSFTFNEKDSDDYFQLYLTHSSTATAPYLFRYENGTCKANPDGTVTRTVGNMPSPMPTQAQDLWVRVTVNPDDGSGLEVRVRCAIDKNDLDSAADCLTYDPTGDLLTGGHVGFGVAGYTRVDEISLQYHDGSDWATDSWDGFDMQSGKAAEALIQDAAGNVTYDGRYVYVYDAWNRLVGVKRAHRDDTDGTLQETSVVATMTYDGLGRRITKKIENSGDWNATYQYYYDGQRMIELQNGSDWVLKQYVWGQTYVDELVQIAVNGDPDVDSDCLDGDSDASYYALQDANFNVLGLIESDGDLEERYEYTPYGQRTVYKSAGSDDPLCMAPLMESQRVEISSVAQPYGLCDVGHQGLLHDKEFGLLHNRARTLHPRLGRFLQRDLEGYAEGMGLYSYCLGSPIARVDWLGLASRSATQVDLNGDRDGPQSRPVFDPTQPGAIRKSTVPTRPLAGYTWKRERLPTGTLSLGSKVYKGFKSKKTGEIAAGTVAASIRFAPVRHLDCKAIGFIQTVQQFSRSTRLPGGHKTWAGETRSLLGDHVPLGPQDLEVHGTHVDVVSMDYPRGGIDMAQNAHVPRPMWATGKHWQRGVPFSETEARMWDRPQVDPDSVVRFETCAVCIEGGQKGCIYGCVDWGFSTHHWRHPRVFDVDVHNVRFYRTCTRTFWKAVQSWNRQANRATTLRGRRDELQVIAEYERMKEEDPRRFAERVQREFEINHPAQKTFDLVRPPAFRTRADRLQEHFYPRAPHARP